VDRPGLADFLRSRRERLRPADVGMAAGQRRRTPGLRREEVALLSAISVDYYTRLEQARGPVPSRQVLSGLARALRLSDDERAHLFYLSGETPGPPSGPPKHVRPGVLHLLDRLDDAAAMVLDASYEVLAWNHLATALIVDFSALRRKDRNLARRRFLLEAEEQSRYEPEEIESFGRLVVGDLRAASARYPDDPDLHELIEELRSGSTEFATLWAQHEVRAHRGLRKAVTHPSVGRMVLDAEVLLIPDQDQRVVLYTAEPGTPSHESLRLLTVIGTQDLRTP
jgi:transcriptional regulator with XRE-family HTH domain